MAQAVQDIQCGFCFRKIDGVLDPKVLPCKHISCMECLSNCYETKHLLVCGEDGCREVFELAPVTLPSHETCHDKHWCGVCEKKGDIKQEAVIYCTQCLKRFCKEHLEVHDAVLEDHPKISMAEFKALNAKAKPNMCEKHEDQANILGCKVCRSICCAKCVPDLDSCDNATSHILIPLDDLSSIILLDGTPDSAAKEDKYEELFKEASKLQSAYDSDTAAMLTLVHETRDAQLDAVRLQYNVLENELLENRSKSKTKIASFLEEALLQKWSQLRSQRQMLESKVKHAQSADIVQKFEEWREELARLILEDFPSLRVESQLQLKKRDERRGIELELISTDDISIGDQPLTSASIGDQPLTSASIGEQPLTSASIGEQPLTSASIGEQLLTSASIGERLLTSASIGERLFASVRTLTGSTDRPAASMEMAWESLHPIPDSLKFLESVQLCSRPASICEHNTNTYVAMDDSVCRIDRNYKCHNFLSNVNADSISVYDKRVYILSCSSPCTVSVYNMSGHLQHSWSHPSYDHQSDMLTVVNDQVLIADPTKKKIIIYSLTGKYIRYIRCWRLSNTNIAMRAVDSNSVVISNFDKSKVSKLNLNTGKVMWTVSSIIDPGGLVTYGNHILVAARKGRRSLYY